MGRSFNHRAAARTLFGLVALTAALWGGASPAAAQSAEPLTVAVMTSTAPGSDRQTAAAIRAYTAWRAERANAAGGVRGRPLRMVYYDDANDVEKTKANIEAALAEPDLLGIVGVWSSTRGAEVVGRVGASGVPFISEISRQELIADHPNIFSMARAAGGDLPAFVDLVSSPPKRVVYFGVEGDLFTLQFKETLERLAAEERVEVVSWEWTPDGADLDPAAIQAAIARIKAETPDLLIFAVGSARGGVLLNALAEAGVTTPVYAASGSMVRMLNAVAQGEYAGEMFQTRSSVPGVTNSRLAALTQDPDFVAVGADYPAGDRSYGAAYADVLGVLIEAAEGPSSRSSAAEIQADAIAALAKTADGSAMFRGATRDWNFDRNGSAIEPVYLLRRPPDSRQLQLYKRQVAVGPDGAARRAQVALLGLDLVEINAIESAAKTFDASFYVSIESRDGLRLRDFEFSNVAPSDVGGAPLLSVRELKSQRMNEGETLRIYKVDGRFQFEPDLTRYPFDRQTFSIQIQPADAGAPIVVQPPPEALRDRSYQIRGWSPATGAEGDYVGADNDLITVAAEGASKARVIAFQRYSYAFVAERQSLDYYLRVVLPLSLIMLVAYFSVFMPRERFDSAVSLQVTALLSTIALYLAIPKISPDVATLSDQTFVFGEAVIVLIIALSILQANVRNWGFGLIARGLSVVQILSFPLLAYAMLSYVDAVRRGETETFAGKSLAETAEIFVRAVWG